MRFQATPLDPDRPRKGSHGAQHFSRSGTPQNRDTAQEKGSTTRRGGLNDGQGGWGWPPPNDGQTTRFNDSVGIL